MRIGVDFDNTIVCYDDVFRRAALELHLIPEDLPAGKGRVRDYLRRAGEEDAWTELQGTVYGLRIAEADPFPGVVKFFERGRELGATLSIVSHKTRWPFRGPRRDLHEAAHEWLEQHGFYDASRIGLGAEDVSFVATKREKLARIGELGCTHFVDDLPEFLMEDGFPANIQPILFDPHGQGASEAAIVRVGSWAEIDAMLLGGDDSR